MGQTVPSLGQSYILWIAADDVELQETAHGQYQYSEYLYPSDLYLI